MSNCSRCHRASDPGRCGAGPLHPRLAGDELRRCHLRAHGEPARFYKAQIVWNLVRGGWDLALQAATGMAQEKVHSELGKVFGEVGTRQWPLVPTRQPQQIGPC